MSAVVTVATGTVLAGGYGIASATGVTGAPGSHHGGPRSVAGTVSNVSGDSFTVSKRNGSTETVLTTTATKYRESGTPDAPTGVAVGEHVLVYLAGWHGQAPGSTSTTSSTSTTIAATPLPPTAALVDIILPSVAGRVLTAGDGTFTISGPRGGSTTVDTSSSTQWYEGRQADPSKSVSTGELVVAYSSTTPATTPFSAAIIDVFPAPAKHPHHQPPTTTSTTSSTTSTTSTTVVAEAADSHPAFKGLAAPSSESRLSGKVTAVSGDTITVTEDPSGATGIITVSSSTKYVGTGTNCQSTSSTTTVPAIAVGEFVSAVGTSTGANSLTASVVDVRSADPASPGPWTGHAATPAKGYTPSSGAPDRAGANGSRSGGQPSGPARGAHGGHPGAPGGSGSQPGGY